MIITRELVEEMRTVAGGFTGIAMRILSGQWKPKTGWTHKCLGRTVTASDLLKIIESNEKRKKKNEAKIVKNAPVLFSPDATDLDEWFSQPPLEDGKAPWE